MRLRVTACGLAAVVACTDPGAPPLRPDTHSLAGAYALQFVNASPWPYCTTLSPDEVACYTADLTLTADGGFTARWIHTHTIISLGLELRDTTFWSGKFAPHAACGLDIAPPNEPNGRGLLSGRHLTFAEDSAAAFPRVWRYAAAESSMVC